MFFTGRKHAGENFARVLAQRATRPAISPRSLILSPRRNSRLEFAGINVFKSTIEPLSHRNARATLKSQENDRPTI